MLERVFKYLLHRRADTPIRRIAQVHPAILRYGFYRAIR